MSLHQVAHILSQTFEARADTRRNAEKELAALSRTPGYGMAVLQLVCTDGVSAEIKMAAAVALKNFIKINWGEAAEVEVDDSEQSQLRQNILIAMFSSSGNLQQQLSYAVYLMAKKDFPERWPDLVTGLANNMSGDNLERLQAALGTMNQLFMKYRFESKSTELWTELKACLIAVQAPLTLLLENLLAYTADTSSLSAEVAFQLFDLLNSALRVFHSLCSQDLPEFFEDNLATWVNGMLQLLQVEVPSLSSSFGEATPLDKTKTEICEVVTMYAQKYEEEIMPFMEQLISTIWHLLRSTPSDTRYDGTVCAALDFLSAICQRAQYEATFSNEEALKLLAEDVAVRNLTLRQEDLELFEDEPLEFLKKDLEGSDTGTRRKGAVDLVRSLCRRFESKLTPILGATVTSFLEDGGNWLMKDVVYCLVRAMASKTETAKSGATSTSQLINIADFYSSQVRVDLCSDDVNSLPVLKADALKFVVLFRGQLPHDALHEAIAAMNNLLTSQHTILHKYAAYALDRLLLLKVQPGNTLLFSSSNLPVSSLLSRLLSAFEADPKAQNSAYLMKALMRVLLVIDESTARSAGEIASRLVLMVDGVVKNPADPVHTHFLFESICILIKKASSMVEGGIDRNLLPVIESILSQELVDLVPYALQITGLLLMDCQKRNAPSDSYLAFLPHLLKPELWAKTANVPAALTVLESYTKVLGERVMSEHGALIMQHFSRLIGSKALDHYGFQLANIILPVISYVGGVENAHQVLLNQMFRRVQFAKTPKFIKHFVVFFFRFVVVAGAQNVAQILESIQSGMYPMVMEKVVGAELRSLADCTTQIEKRTCAIGLADVLENTLNAISCIFGQLTDAGVALCEGAVLMGAASHAEMDEAYSDDGDISTQFCRLSHAAPPEALRPHITNWKKYLAEALLHRVASSQPAALSCISDHARATLTAYLRSQ